MLDYEKPAKKAFNGKLIKQVSYLTRQEKQINTDVSGAISDGRKEPVEEWRKKVDGLDDVIFVSIPTGLRTPYEVRRLLEAGVCSVSPPTSGSGASRVNK